MQNQEWMIVLHNEGDCVKWENVRISSFNSSVQPATHANASVTNDTELFNQVL